MEGGGGSYRVETERWLTIAEKLLVARDLQGAKTFAVRARDSSRDSDSVLLQYSDQIIAVADTLLAAELRVKDHNNGTETHDYYALLQLPRLTHSMDLIATQYRKLALILNPSRNRFAYADQAFRLVSDAWMLFSNPQRKPMYDSLLQPVQLGLSAAQFAANQGFIDAAMLPQSQVRSSTINNNSDGSMVVDPEPVTTNQWVPVSTQLTRQYTTQEHQFTNSAAAAAATATFPTQPFLAQQTRPIAQPKQQQPTSTESPRPTQPVWISQPPATKPAVAQSQPSKATTESSASRVAPQRGTPEAVTPVSSRPAAPQQSPPPPVAATPVSTRPAAAQRSPPVAATPVSTRPAAAQRTPPLAATPVSTRAAAAAQRSPPLAATPVSSRPAADTPQQKQTSQPQGPSFWTACPYCFNLYEYPKVYEECALKCQSCKRGFHAAAIAAPPVSSKDSHFCCWGFFPLGYLGGSKDSELGGSNWSPFSAMFPTPVQPGVNYKVPSSSAVAADAGKAPPRPKVIYKDDDYIDLSDSSDDDYSGDDKSDSDDDDWDRTVKKAKTTTPPARRGRPPSKNVKKVERGRKRAISRNVDGSGSTNGVVQNKVMVGEGSSSARKSKGGKDLGKLDLNVMFSNEVEEAAAGVSSEGNEATASHGGVEDNIEGIGFFEGLDEFLSSLPILVGDDKVKAT
ncbi:unnamed protein product [Linum trigynum]|uniref:J domain-containing protein n=1 Tax=Linum trigynum TaxID=586398 RepID=A0AAV2E1G8_9ROSI